MTTKHEHLEACARLCLQFGEKLAIVSQSEYDALFDQRAGWHRAVTHLDGELYKAPFTSAHGLHWGRKIIYTIREREEVGSILHEMGHVFAQEHHPDHLQCHEWDFFGWELALARQIGAARAWSQHNRNSASPAMARSGARALQGNDGSSSPIDLPTHTRSECSTQRVPRGASDE